MAARPTNAEWMIHPSFVFKSFEESIIKTNFPQFSQSPHIVPEKILESFVDPSGLRCYRVKWLDSWLTEQHISATFPHLITEYWINKPINDSEYQNYAGPTTRSPAPTIHQQVNQPTPQTPSTSHAAVVAAAEVVAAAANEKVSAIRNENEKSMEQNPADVALTDINNIPIVSSSGMPVPQLFSTDDNNKVNEQQQQQQASNDPSNPDFVVESLRLPERVGLKEVQDMVQDGQEKDDRDKSSLVPLLPKSDDTVYLATSMYNFAMNDKDKIKQTNANFQKVAPVSVFNHLQHFGGQQGIPLPSIDQINNQTQQQLQTQSLSLELARSLTDKRPRFEVGAIEKKQPSKKVAAKKEPKDKQPVACDICGKMISSRKNLRVHKTVRHFKNGSFACGICGRKFALNRDLQRHMPLHTNERNYICKYCGLQCKQPGHLTKHLRTHTEIMNWRCDCCFKNFKVQAELKEHCFSEHTDIKDKNLTCSVCKERLKLPNSVYLHSLRHSGVREHECQVCKATFKLKQHLQVHLRTHEKPKEVEAIACPICEKVFKAKHMYDRHINKHTESTAEEFKENKRLKAEEKKQRRRSKRKQSETSQSASEDDEGADSGDAEIIPAKRKQRKPTKVLYDEDLNTKLVVRKKFDQKEEHCCPHCNDVFRSGSLLRSHLKLHRRAANEAAILDNEKADKDSTEVPMLFSMSDDKKEEENTTMETSLIKQIDDLNNASAQTISNDENNSNMIIFNNSDDPVAMSTDDDVVEKEEQVIKIVFLKDSTTGDLDGLAQVSADIISRSENDAL